MPGTRANRLGRNGEHALISRALLLLLLGLAIGAACGGGGTAPNGGGDGILFIGNSLTYTNDLPGTLADVAAQGGHTLRVSSVALPSYALVDHASGQGSDANARIAAGGWRAVVMQQGPSSVPLNRDTLVVGARALAVGIAAVGARPALYMVWPASDAIERFDAVREAYRAAACAVRGDFLPAGEAWRIAWRRDATLALYGPDGFHPSPLGTYLAALVMYERYTDGDARDLPDVATADGAVLDTPAATVQLLQEAAHEANAAAASGPCSRGAALDASR